MTFAVCFTNFGPYHLARLRALADRLGAAGNRLIAYEVAGREQTYPWSRSRLEEPFTWITLFPDRVLETIEPAACRRAMVQALDRDQPDALGLVGYARPESMAAARWARRHGRPAILMSESQAIDRPHTWWKELIKMRRVRQFDAALVGGPAHRDYLVELGMPAEQHRPGIQRGRQRLLRHQGPLLARQPDRSIGLARRSLFLDGMPVRAREKPGPADPGFRALS